MASWLIWVLIVFAAIYALGFVLGLAAGWASQRLAQKERLSIR